MGSHMRSVISNVRGGAALLGTLVSELEDTLAAVSNDADVWVDKEARGWARLIAGHLVVAVHIQVAVLDAYLGAREEVDRHELRNLGQRRQRRAAWRSERRHRGI